MRTTAGILMLGVLAWVAGPGQAAEKKVVVKGFEPKKPLVKASEPTKPLVKSSAPAKPLVKVFEKKADIKQCAGSTCCGAPVALGAPVSTGVVHETNCPKTCCGTSHEPVCLGTSTKKGPPGRCQKFQDWVCYRPLQSSKCCSPSCQPMPTRTPHVWEFFAHRCCHCEHAGIVDSTDCDLGCAAPSCASCAVPAPSCCAKAPSCAAKTPATRVCAAVKKPLLARKKSTDQFATDVAQPVGYKEVVK